MISTNPKHSKKLEQRVLSVIQRKKLWSPGDAVTLAVSGGVDSMVMLDVLAQTRRSHKGDLNVVTFDHGFRTESADEVEFVRSVCLQHQVPCCIHHLQLDSGPNKQERARNARREFLLQQQGWIATAHHASDQAETVLFRMLRGSGLDGLQGIQVKSDRWVKPLLMEFKEDILHYAQVRELEWREDPSNVHSTRGAIRGLWQTLSQVHPNPEKAMASVATVLSRDAAYLDSQAKESMQDVAQDNQLTLSLLRTYHPSIQSRIIRMWFWNNDVNVKGSQVELLLAWMPSRNGAIFQVSKNVQVVQRHGVWSIC